MLFASALSFVTQAANKTVYFDNSKTNWSDVKIYWFKNSDNNTWPGTSMTSVGNSIYKATNIPEGATIIFNSGSEQTKDIANVGDNSIYIATSKDISSTRWLN